MTLTAIVLPGQGSQVPGMRDAVARARPDLLDVRTAARAAGLRRSILGVVLAKLAPRCVPDAQIVALDDGTALARAA